MQGNFWSNTIWYAILLALTIAMFAVAVAKADNKRFLIAFTAAVLGLFYLFEYVLVAVTDAYSYHPMLFPNDGFQDNVVGNMFSQTSIVATCALVIVIKPKPVWYAVFAAAYFLIESLFHKLGIYDLNWYKTYYTPIILVPLFWAVRRWHHQAALSQTDVSGNVLLFLGTMALLGNSLYLPLKIFRIHVFTGGFFDNLSRDHTTTQVLYLFFFVGASAFIYRRAGRWYWRAALFAVLYLIQYAAFKAGLMVFRLGWFPWVTLLEICACLLWIKLLDSNIQTRRPSGEGLPATQ